MRYALFGFVLLTAAAPILGQDRKANEYTSEYLPLKVGASWSYVGNDGKERVTVTVEKSEPLRWKSKSDKGDKGEKTESLLSFLLRTTSGDKSLQEQVVVAPDGIYRVAAAGKEIVPPLRLMKLPAAAGDVWAIDSESETVKLTGSFAVDRATLDLPGRGPTAAFVVSSVDFYAGKERVETKFWFAKNLGIVKQHVKVGKFELKLDLLPPGSSAPPSTSGLPPALTVAPFQAPPPNSKPIPTPPVSLPKSPKSTATTPPSPVPPSFGEPPVSTLRPKTPDLPTIPPLPSPFPK